MSKRKHYTKERITKVIVGYGLHIWFTLILANIVVLFVTNFFLRAAPSDTPLQPSPTIGSASAPSATESAVPLRSDFQATESASATPSARPTIRALPTPTPRPIGAVLRLSFQLPGIGSNSAQFDPVHKTRKVTVYFYDPDSNSSDSRIDPLHAMQVIATYDDNQESPTYSSFVNKFVDLGTTVPDGQYQIVLQTDKSLRKLVKEKEDSVGGKIFSISKYIPTHLDSQTFIVGDVYPIGGDNIMDMSDYNVLVTCFGLRESSPACSDRLAGDIDDNGIVDGVDYNLMVLSFRELLGLGLPVPTIDIKVSPTVVKSLSELTPTPTRFPTPLAKLTITKIPKPSTASKAAGLTAGSQSGSAGIVFVFILIVVALGVLVFLYLRNQKFKSFVVGLLPLGKAKQPVEELPPDPNATGTEEQPVSTDVPVAEGEVPATEAEQPISAEPTTEMPPAEETTPAETPTETVTPTEPAPEETPLASADGTIDKEYFVKKQSEDDAKTGFWLSLTGDEGQTLAHYTGTAVVDGFAHIKGVMKTEGDKKFIEVSELTPSE